MTRAQLDAIHHAQLSEHGGASGVADERKLESALNRARNKFAYGEADRCVLAAAYAFGLAKNHGYVDGNKRTAFMASYLFLGLNGLDIRASEPEVAHLISGLAAGTVTEATFATWLREHVRPMPRPT